jgi:hypothetical protein
MFSKILFGVEHSPQRKLCVLLSIVLTLMGVAIIPTRGYEWGVPFLLLGLAAVAIMSRTFAAHDAKVATSEQLTNLPGEYDAEALRQMVDHAPHDPNDQLGRVTGQLDVAEIRAAVEHVRGDAGSGAPTGSYPIQP